MNEKHQIVLDKASYAVRHCVSKDKTRPALHSVVVEHDCTVACDGRTLAMVEHGKANRASYDVGNVQIPPGMVKAMRPTGRDSLAWVDLGPDEGRTIGKGMTSAPLNPPEFQYPDWRAIVPAGEQTQIAMLDVAQMEQIVKAAKEAGVQTLAMHTATEPPKYGASVVVLTGETADCRAVKLLVTQPPKRK